MNILENIKFGANTKSKNVLTSIKSEIYDFFEYMDCDKDGYITSENIFKSFKILKTEYPMLSTMVNDFVLKTMELKTATLDVKDFSFGTLLGMFERVVSLHNFDET